MASLDNIFDIDCDTVLCPAGALGVMDIQTENCNDVNQSEVNSLIMWHPTLGVPPTNWGAGIAAIDFDIDNTDATDIKQKQIFVKGGMPASEEVTKTLNSFQDVVINRTHTLTLELYTFGDDTYDYLRKLQCNKVKPLFDFTTVGGKLFGKDGGISPVKFALDFLLEEGEENCEKWSITISWKSLTAPDRFDNPLA